MTISRQSLHHPVNEKDAIQVVDLSTFPSYSLARAAGAGASIIFVSASPKSFCSLVVMVKSVTAQMRMMKRAGYIIRLVRFIANELYTRFNY